MTEKMGISGRDMKIAYIIIYKYLNKTMNIINRWKRLRVK